MNLTTNNNNTRDNVYGAVIMTQVIVRVQLVHLMNERSDNAIQRDSHHITSKTAWSEQ